MDLRIKRETFAAPEDHRWLGSAHGTEATESITLDGARWAGHASLQAGAVPSGVVVARDATSGLGVPYNPNYDADAVTAGVQPNGADVPVGFLFTTKDLDGADHNVTAALLTHGKIQQSFLPAGHGLTAAAKTSMGARFTYLGTLA